MLLYEVLTDDVDSNIRLYKPTNIHFPSTAKFRSEAKKNGAHYQGKVWILFPEGKKPPEEIVIRPVEAYQIKLFDKKEG